MLLKESLSIFNDLPADNGVSADILRRVIQKSEDATTLSLAWTGLEVSRFSHDEIP